MTKRVLDKKFLSEVVVSETEKKHNYFESNRQILGNMNKK